MEKWQADLYTMLENMCFDVEHFFQDLGEVMETVAEEVVEAFEVTVVNFEETLATEIDYLVRDLLAVELDFEIDIDVEEMEIRDIVAESQFYTTGLPVAPTSVNHPACIGCRHYHGRAYGGNLLICAMHPYGWEDEHCPDWQD